MERSWVGGKRLSLRASADEPRFVRSDLGASCHQGGMDLSGCYLCAISGMDQRWVRLWLSQGAPLAERPFQRSPALSLRAAADAAAATRLCGVCESHESVAGGELSVLSLPEAFRTVGSIQCGDGPEHTVSPSLELIRWRGFELHREQPDFVRAQPRRTCGHPSVALYHGVAACGTLSSGAVLPPPLIPRESKIARPRE